VRARDTVICPNCGFTLEPTDTPLTINVGGASPNEDTSPKLPAMATSRSSFPNTPLSDDRPPDPYENLSWSGFAGEGLEGFPSDTDQDAPNFVPPVDDQLPRRYARLSRRRPPDLAGVIILVQSQEELPMPGAVGSIATALRDIIWPMPQQQAREKVHVTTFRVRTQDDEQKDARIEGYLKGANLTLGDKVSLWGWHRKGVLIVRRGYNHTSKGDVTSTVTGSAFSSVVLLIVAVAGMLLLLYLYLHGYLSTSL
jgi:translation initiation factor IF-1